jgi:signal transduction histidine kinase
MRLSIKAKQMIGVTAIVGCVVSVASGLYLQSLARIRLEESRARGDLIAHTIYHRVWAAGTGGDPAATLRADAGLRSILEASAYDRNVTYAAVVDVSGRAIAHSDSLAVGQSMAVVPLLENVLSASVVAQFLAIYSDRAPTLEVQLPLLAGGTPFGSIRVGVSMLLVRVQVNQAMRPALIAALGALGAAVLVALLLAQSLLRPINLIRSGLTRLGHGEFGVTLDMPQHDELGELGGFFNALSTRLSADRTRAASEAAQPGSAVDRLEDAVALITPEGRVVFASQTMRDSLPAGFPGPGTPFDALLPDGHAYRLLVDESRRTGASQGPVRVPSMGGVAQGDGDASAPRPSASDRIARTYVIAGADDRPPGILLVVRDLGYLDEVETSLKYSRRLSAIGRLTAGVAHEIKNPINAIMIHLELLKQRIAAAEASRGTPPTGDTADESNDFYAARDHLSVITSSLRRLDEVVQGFLKFARPEELTLQPVSIAAVLDELMPVIDAAAQSNRVDVRIDCADKLPAVRGDSGMLRQALLNLALNACEAMPDGGRLRIAARAIREHVELLVEDTGVGIAESQLGRVFDLYYTTKEGGSGIGLSMVYRTIQLHDGEIEVQSTPGHGTVFRIELPQF